MCPWNKVVLDYSFKAVCDSSHHHAHLNSTLIWICVLHFYTQIKVSLQVNCTIDSTRQCILIRLQGYLSKKIKAIFMQMLFTLYFLVTRPILLWISGRDLAVFSECQSYPLTYSSRFWRPYSWIVQTHVDNNNPDLVECVTDREIKCSLQKPIRQINVCYFSNAVKSARSVTV